MTTYSVDDWLARLPDLKRIGREYHGACPVCGGKDCFHVKEGKDGAASLYCRKWC